MNLKNIRLFVLTFQKGSFSSVAEFLNISASSVSRGVADLEAELNTRLFQRNTRTLKPTNEGLDYYEKVFPLLEDLDALHDNFGAIGQTPSGTIRISASTTFAQCVLSPLLKPFSEKYPLIQIELVLSDSRINLIENQIDIAIRHGDLADSTLVSRKLIDVDYFLVASPDYISEQAEITCPDDLNHHRIITFNLTDFSKQWRFSKKTNRKSITIKPHLTCSNAAMIRDCVEHNTGIALLADWTVKQSLKNGSLVQVLPDWQVSGENQHSAIWLLQASRQFRPSKITAFTNFLLDWAKSKGT